MSQHEKDLYNWIQENYDLGKHIPRVNTDYSLEVPGRTYFGSSDSSTSIDINPKRIHEAEKFFLNNKNTSPQSTNLQNIKGYVNRGLSQKTDSTQKTQLGFLDFILGHEVGHVLPTSIEYLPNDDPRKIKFNKLDKEIPQTKEGKADLMSLAFYNARNNNFPATVKFPQDTAGFSLIEEQIKLFRKNRKP